MRFNVAELLKAATGASKTVDLHDELPFDEADATLVAPVQGQLQFIREPGGILVEGALETEARMGCSRCLEPVDVALTVQLEEAFKPTVYIPGGPEVAPASERESETEIDEHHVLDLSEVVRQNLATALPWTVTCRPGCAGLCPQCGANLNKTTCDCVPEVDPRWAHLRALLDEEGTSELRADEQATRGQPNDT